MNNYGKEVSRKLKMILAGKETNVANLATKLNKSNTTMYSKFQKGQFTLKDLDEISSALGIEYEVTFIIDNNERI